MPSVAALMPIGIIAVSFLVGFIFFYVMSPFTNKEKKKQAEAILSLLINFVLYMWAGKILLHLSVFVKDPLAVLAYPADSHAFYLAVLFSVLHIGYKVRRQGLDAQQLLYAFAYVFLFSSFVYECIDIIWMGNRYTWGYLGLLFVLLLLLILMQHTSRAKLNAGLLLIWGLGQLVLAFALPFAAAFGYLMAPWFLIIVLAVSIYLIWRNTYR
jgi:hypothetical protein